MKKRLCAALLALLAVVLCGCGMILVEDGNTVQIGMAVSTEP